jgi:two-component system phosphate regulon sensor histidine kinase PhoR
MKKRLFLIIIIISVIASSLACTLTTYVYYNFYVSEAKSQLKTIVELQADYENWENESKIIYSVNKILKASKYSMRFTIINIDGEVIYDNWAKDDILENHKDRPEIAQAFNNGAGEYTRYSDTFATNMYYYAYKINDDEVLRVSREISSINSVFLSITPMLFVLFAVLLVVVYLSAGLFIKKILRPINEMTKTLDEMLDKDERADLGIYEEFEPLSNKILEQKIKINQYIEELKQERDTISIITENMKEGFILINRDKNILSINTSGRHMVGNDKFNLRNKRNILELTRNVEILERIDDALEDNKHIVYDTDSNKKYFRYYFSPVKEQNSTKVAGLLILIEDVTMQKDAEIMRSEFSANVSHELKTPLTTMNGFAEMIKEGFITDLPSIQKYSGMIYKEGLRLISLIEDIMRLSKIEEKFDIEENPIVNLKETAQYVVSVLGSKAEGSNVKLELNAQDAFMKANKNYMNELLYNLVDNSIKYNKSGGSVEVNIDKSDDLIIINIKDTGFGIPAEHKDRIFERFYRVDKSRSKETGGTGLGLSIVKHITELYDGVIELDSEESNGTEVTIKFPLNNYSLEQ